MSVVAISRRTRRGKRRSAQALPPPKEWSRPWAQRLCVAKVLTPSALRHPSASEYDARCNAQALNDLGYFAKDER